LSDEEKNKQQKMTSFEELKFEKGKIEISQISVPPKYFFSHSPSVVYF
jgi:hypothetical protein